jgi:hypothetical protein
MPRIQWILSFATLVGLTLSSSNEFLAQTPLRQGVMPFTQLAEWANDGSTTLSQGVLADLQTDPYFDGDFQMIYDTAAGILDGYTIVHRGGYFPENAGIPREQQLTTAEAAYHIFSLDNGNELFLFRSPMENTSRYFIRGTGRPVLMR